MQAAFQHRATLMESNYRDLTRAQHDDFKVALEKAAIDIQKRLWDDLQRIRAEYERLIHNELRVIRQRSAFGSPTPLPQHTPPAAPAAVLPVIDWLHLAERFRGSEESVKQRQAFYVPRFAGCGQVLDLGCGRGEFLELMRKAGVSARGIDQSEEMVALCRHKGLEAECADLFGYLANVTGAALDGIFCAHVVEHLPPERIPALVQLAASKRSGGLLAVETPNPECLAIFASHFYQDPTHTRPVPPSLMTFYLEEAGFGRIEVHQMASAMESLPAVGPLPEEFRKAFFGGMDYAVLARKLS
jgi:O-antigen chain-terminating methyltransferase